jgi:hypothetical protein
MHDFSNNLGFGLIGVFHGNCLLHVDSELDLLISSIFSAILGFFPCS